MTIIYKNKYIYFFIFKTTFINHKVVLNITMLRPIYDFLFISMYLMRAN